MKLFLAGLVMLTTFKVMAEPQCTGDDKAKWKNEEAFRKELELQYKIKKFKVTKGNCFEIYGLNKEGKKVEIYFNPVTGEKVKERIE